MGAGDPWADAGYQVETPERIALGYDVAGLGSRFLAALVDTTILTVAAILVMVLGILAVGGIAGLIAGIFGAEVSESIGMVAVAIALLLTFVSFWGYYVFFEVVWHGRSPGKAWLGLRVIKEGGYPVGFGDSAIRNVVRIVDFLPFYYIVGTLVMFIDVRSRRLGDLAAGTLVVKERRDIKLETIGTGLPSVPPGTTPALAEDESPIPNLSRLTPSDRSLVREYFLRRSSLEEQAALALARQIANALARKLEYDLTGESPDAFLSRLASQVGR